MSRRPQQKFGLALAKNPNDGFKKASLIKVGSDGKLQQYGKNNISPYSPFLINPSSWTESKVSNWVEHHIPGQSSPIYQWVSGGARIVSFEALVTKDSSYFLKEEKNPLASILGSAINAVGNIASSFAGINIPPISDMVNFFFDPKNSVAGEELSIHDYLNYYRSLMYPIYSNNILTSSPPLVVLNVGKTFSNIDCDVNISATTDLWIVLNININITKQLPNLSPMEAIVNFTLAQYEINPRSADSFSLEPIKTETSLSGLSALTKGFL